MVGRLVFWILIGLVVWWVVKPRRKVAPPPVDAPSAPTGGSTLAEPMVDCAACGLHFPASEAVRDGARVFCCTAHRDAGPKRAG